MLKALLKDSAIYMAGKALAGVALFFVVPLYLYLAGPSIYGKYSLLISLSTFVATLLSTGFIQSLSRYYLSNEAKECIASIFKYILLFLMVVIVSLVALNFVHAAFVTTTVATLILYLYGRVYYQAKMEKLKFVIKDLVRSLIILGGPYIYFLYSGNIESEFVFAVCFSLGNLSVIGMDVWRTLILSSNRVDSFQVRRVTRFGIPVAAWLTMAAFMVLMDRQIAEAYFGDEVLGFFSSLYDVSIRLGALIFLPVSAAIYPLMIRVDKEGALPLKNNWMLLVFFLSISFGVLGFFVYLMIEPFIFTSIVSTNFSFGYLLMMFVGGVLWQAALVIHKGMELLERVGFMVVAMLSAILIHYCIVFLLIGFLGIDVFGFAILVSAIAYIILIVLLTNRFKGDC